MSHEIESDFKEYCDNESRQCLNCTSFEKQNGVGYCNEAKSEVPDVAHCDFFQTKD